MEVVRLEYPEVLLTFGRRAREVGIATLRQVQVGGVEQDIGADGVVVLRRVDELLRLDDVTGLQGVSLETVDLRNWGERLAELPFDTRTVWPPTERLPVGFDPRKRLDEGRNPGLGIRGLHARGIDGRGVGLAIIDQPLLLEHREYRAQLAHFEAIDVDGSPPQYHAPRVASVAVGRSLGVAPGARLSFYAVPMWSFDAADYGAVLDRIVERNRSLRPGDRIRVVSVSTGRFPKLRGVEQWRAAMKRAEQAGILVVTCDPEDLRYGLVRITHGADADDPRGYDRTRYAEDDDILLVPGAGRTLASHRGSDVYEFDPQGGMSWGAPWIAGLAALGFQVAPCTTPQQMKRVMVDTATSTAQGPVAAPTRLVGALEPACFR